jgi:hypothetical protein
VALDRGFLYPWAVGAAIWLVVSFEVLSAYVEQTDSAHLREIWFLLSLLWAQFGFAGVFQCLAHRRGRGLGILLLVILAPPLALYLLIVCTPAQ